MKVHIEQQCEKNKKNVFDKETGKFLKTVPIQVTYPYPYGYILDTLAEDGGNLDCYVITDKVLTMASVVECDTIGMVEWFEDGQEDHKILAVLRGEKYAMSEEVKHTITDFALHFFDNQPDKKYRLGNFYNADKAVELMKKSSTPPLNTTL
jgi:inorganic pyrophosphatase